MESIDINKLRMFKESKVIKKVPLISDQLISTIYFLDSNSEIPTHKHQTFDEINYVVSGTGTIKVNGESRPISEGMIILVPKSQTHNITSDQNKMTLLTVNSLQKYARKKRLI